MTVSRLILSKEEGTSHHRSTRRVYGGYRGGMGTSERRTVRTQVQRSGATRALILDAAVACLVSDGYDRTTTVSVQTRAGVSRGRLLHHFPSRTALLVAAARHLAATRIAEMEQWITRSYSEPSDLVKRCDRATELLWETFRQPYFWAAMELWHAARTDPELRSELLVTERQLGRAIKHVIATMYGPTLSSHADFDELRELLFTSMRGEALTYALRVQDDPRTDPKLPLWQRLARTTLLADRQVNSLP
jgi:AcrR family transcriptional regulator